MAVDRDDSQKEYPQGILQPFGIFRATMDVGQSLETHPMRILAFVPGGIGEQISFFPTIDDLHKEYPKATIDVVAEPRSTAAYRVCQAVDRVIPFDFNDTNGPADWGNLLGIVREGEYDLAISSSRQALVGILLWLTGIPVRIGYSGGLGKFLLTQAVPLEDGYTAVAYHNLLKGLGIDRPCPPLAVTLPKSDLEWAQQECQRLGIDAGYILIHGGMSSVSQSSGIEKAYPPAKWQQVIQELQKRQNKPIAIVRGPDDDTFVGEIVSACPDVKQIVPPDIGKLAATIANANIMLCTDSGPMHLSIAVGTYTLALFGPTSPKKLMPPNNDRCLAVASATGKIADIPPADIVAKLFANS
jgi:ADP-heptose:LPS heptosyltransferase